jgi:hypothetical protein
MGVQVFRSPQLGPDDVVLYFVGIRRFYVLGGIHSALLLFSVFVMVLPHKVMYFPDNSSKVLLVIFQPPIVENFPFLGQRMLWT